MISSGKSLAIGQGIYDICWVWVLFLEWTGRKKHVIQQFHFHVYVYKILPSPVQPPESSQLLFNIQWSLWVILPSLNPIL